MPAGYSLLPRRGPQPAPTLVRLAGIMAQHPEIQLQHVHSHTGHPLNEAADALASLAQRGLPAVETRSRAEGLVEAFVRSWHEQAGERLTGNAPRLLSGGTRGARVRATRRGR